MRNILKFLITKIYSKLIIFNLFLLSLKKNKKYFYNHSLGFGDSFDYYIHNYQKIKRNKEFIPLSFGNFNEEIISFFFSRYKRLFFRIPSFFPYYLIVSEVKKSKYFNPMIDYHIENTGYVKGGGIITDKKNVNFFLSKILKKKIIKKDIIELCKRGPYVSIFLKHYNSQINNVFDGTNIRQTCNLKKIFLLIEYFKKKKIKIIILGNKFDRGILLLKKKLKNLDYLMDLKPSLSDQLFVAKNSLGYVGNHGGSFIPYLFFKKKIITFDSNLNPDTKKNCHNNKIIQLYKKVSIDNSAYRTLSIDDKYFYAIKKFKIKETSFLEIKKAIKDFLFI
jgi:hypothetical protein